MTPYDPELTMGANTRILMDHLMTVLILPSQSKSVTEVWAPWMESDVRDFLKAAYQDGYDEARAYWLVEGYIPEVPDEP